MKKLILLAVASAFSAGTAFAATGVVTNGTTVTFTVDAGDTLTYDEPIGAAIKNVYKKGAGRLIVTQVAGLVADSGVSVRIEEGIAEQRIRGGLGNYNNVYISKGAQLYLNFNGAWNVYSPIPTYIKGIAGSGPDGTGALRISSAVTQDWTALIRNEFTLTDDTTIWNDSAKPIGFGSSATLNLNGHTLTVNGNGAFHFKRTDSNVAGPVINPGSGGGHIIANTPGWTHIYNDSTFKGDASSTLTFTKASAIVFNTLSKPLPWTLRLMNTAGNIIRFDGTKDRKYNVLGPIEYAGEVGFGGTSGVPVTFRGRIKFIGTVTDKNCWRINNDGTQIYFDSQDPLPSKFQLSMSGNADCYFLTDTSFPRWDAEDGFYYFSGPAQYDTRNCELWLGSQGDTNYCTGLGVARAIESFSTWSDYKTSRQLRFRTFGDFTAGTGVTKELNQNLFEMVHTGVGTLDFAGAFDSSINKPFHYRNNETNVTVFSGNHYRNVQTLFVQKGTVKVGGGSMRTCEYLPIGGNNDVVNPTLVVGKGALLYPAKNDLEIRSLETGSKPALLKIEAGGLITNKFVSTYANASDQAAGKVYKAAVNQYGDVVTWNGGYIANWCGLGFWGLGGGSLTTPGSTYLLGMKGTRGVFQQDGGTNHFTGTLYLCNNGCNDYLMRGGRMIGNGVFYMVYNDAKEHDEGDRTVFTMMGDDPVVDLSDRGDFNLNTRTNGYVTTFNLNAGRFIPRTMGTTRSTENNPNYFNFNGGTLVWENGFREAIWKKSYAPTAITLYEKGGTIEVNKLKNEDLKTNVGAYVASDRVYLSGMNDGEYQLSADNSLTIRALSGRGIKSIRIPDDMPRTGYVGIMPVKILGGDGFGATAALDFDMKTGTIAEELLVTCSGNDYTDAPTVVAYGPDYVTEYVCTVELTDEDRVAGPLVKTGPGTLTLKAGAKNTFVGPYVVSNGTLFANHEATIPAGMKLFLAGGTFNWDWRSITLGTLGGWGTVFGNIGVDAYHANVTDAFVVDAADLSAGRFLKVRNEGDGYCLNHTVAFGAGCVVKVENPELLDRNASYLMFRQSAKINRKPQLDPELTEKYRLSLRNGGKELWIKGKLGMTVIVR